MKPVNTYTYTPDSLGLSYETVKIMTKDSLLLNAWVMKPTPVDDKKTTVIIAGGDAGNMSNYCYHAYLLVMKGYTVVTFDYRGFGESAPFIINEKFLYYNQFGDDLEAVIQWSKDQWSLNKTGVWAFSMGNIVTALAYQNKPLDFIICEGIPLNPIVVAIRLKLIKQKDVYNPEGAEKIETYFKNIRCKILVFAGTLDQITTLADSKKLCDSSKKRKLIKFTGDHMQGLEAMTKKSFGDKYIEAILKFLKA